MSDAERVCAVPLSADTELRVASVTSPEGTRQLDVRLYRRDGRELRPTAAGLRLPSHLATLAAEAIKAVERSA